jgi:hypothetical protein
MSRVANLPMAARVAGYLLLLQGFLAIVRVAALLIEGRPVIGLAILIIAVVTALLFVIPGVLVLRGSRGGWIASLIINGYIVVSNLASLMRPSATVQVPANFALTLLSVAVSLTVVVLLILPASRNAFRRPTARP